MMKKGIIALAVLAVIVGGLSMGCIETPVDVPEEPNPAGLTAKGLQVKADVAERQARGFVQYTGNISFEEQVEADLTEMLGYDVTLYKNAPTIYSCRCYVRYPDNVAGFDTPYERARDNQEMLNDKIDSLDSLTVSQYLPGCTEKIAYKEFYYNYYQRMQVDYEKMYCTVGNMVIGDFEIERAEKISLNGSA